MTHLPMPRIIYGFLLSICLAQMLLDDTAAAQDVWELCPYRIRALIVADQSPAWTTQRLDELCESLQRLAAAEIGAPWRLQVEVAADPLRKHVLAMQWRTDRPDPGLLNREAADTDKTVLVVLRAGAEGNWTEVWQFDHAANHWGGVCQQRWERWDGVDRVALELMVEGVTPQAMVDRVDGNRVELRLRGALLPIRNPRRAADSVGSVFLLAVRGLPTGARSVLPETFLIVEKKQDATLVGRLVSGYEDPLAGRPVDQWIAVGCRRTHPNTVWEITMQSDAGPRPLAGARVFMSRQPDVMGSLVGQTDRQGRIAIPRTGAIVWLQLRWKSVLLGQIPVLPGNQPSDIWATLVERRHLVAACQLVVCRADFAELLARRAVDQARIAARTKAGRKPDAKKLQEELNTWLKTEVLRVKNSIRDARAKQQLDDSPIDRRLVSSWDQLEEAIDQLK